MKKSRWTLPAVALMAMMSAVSSCSNDVDAFWHFNNKENTNARIQLNLDVASTRAGVEPGSSLENSISSVFVYIFDDLGKLKKIEPVSDLSDKSITLDVSSGLKTIYVVSSKSLNSWPLETSIDDFEKFIFSVGLSSRKATDEFVMIGKSASQYVMKTAADASLPASNVFSVSMVRLLAKAQVLAKDVSGDSFGFTFGTPLFRACQTNDRMKIAADGVELVENYNDEDEDGTYDGYSIGSVTDYIPVKTDAFSVDGCAYMTENYVKTPVSGNTTFISIKVPLIPAKYYTFSNGTCTGSANEDPTTVKTFFAVGVVDDDNGIADYCVDSSTKQVYAFTTEYFAKQYCNALNGGTASAMTVSDTEAPLRAATRAGEENDVRRFEVVTFTDGACYYRVNVGATDSKGTGAKVERNKFYKITINSIKNIGYHSEDLLRPTDPESSLNTMLSTRMQAKFEVADWTVEEQLTDL